MNMHIRLSIFFKIVTKNSNTLDYT